MIRITSILTGHDAYDQIRTVRPLAWPGVKDALWKEGVHVETKMFSEVSLQDLGATDHLVLHGVATPGIMNLLRKLPCRFSVFQDDLMRVKDIPDWNPNKITEAQEQVLGYLLENSAAIVTTTAALRDECGYPEKTVVQGNLEDFSERPGVRPMDVACYCGGNSHAGDIELLNGLEWSGKTIVWSSCLPSSKTAMFRNRQGGMELRPNDPKWGWIQATNKYEEYCVYLKNLAPSVGIGLMPLVDCRFNAAKSVLKFIEMTKCGWVTVVSDVAPYFWLPDNCCIKVGELWNWSDAVAYAAQLPSIAASAWDYCWSVHSYQEHWRDWVSVYQFIASRT